MKVREWTLHTEKDLKKTLTTHCFTAPHRECKDIPKLRVYEADQIDRLLSELGVLEVLEIERICCHGNESTT
jgi:hypothetical protein